MASQWIARTLGHPKYHNKKLVLVYLELDGLGQPGFERPGPAPVIRPGRFQCREKQLNVGKLCIVHMQLQFSNY